MSDIDALNYWRRASAPGGFGSFVGQTNYVPSDATELALPKRSSHVPVDPPAPDTLDDLRCRGILGDKDAHVLVTEKDARRQFRGITCSLMAQPMPAKSLYPVYSHGRRLDGIYVCSPMMALLQMAKKNSLAENILLGLEACGNFRALEDRTSYHCEPLASAKEYRLFVAKHKDTIGILKLREAAPWIADGSASPAEARIVTALALPLMRGGYGLGMPELNPTLELAPEHAQLLGHPTITPDAFWKPQGKSRRPGTPLEYDSGTYHNSAEQLEKDQRRRNAYGSLGMHVIVIRPEHLHDFLKLDALASTLRDDIGLRRPREPKNYPSKHHALLTELFGQRDNRAQIEHLPAEQVAPYGYLRSIRDDCHDGIDVFPQMGSTEYPDWGAS